MRAIHVPREDPCRQAQRRGVRALNRLRLRGVRQDAHHRPEDLLARDRHAVVAIAEHGRLHPVAALAAGRDVRWGREAAAEELGAVDGEAVLDVGEDSVVVRLRHERAHVRARVERGADTDAVHLGEQARFEGGDPGGRHEDARAVRADLAGGAEVGHHGAVDGGVEGGVVEDEQRAFAAKFHGHVLHRAGGGGGHRAARGDLPCETHFGDRGVRGQVCADKAVAVDDVEDAGGEARGGVDLREGLSVQGGEFRGLGGLVSVSLQDGEVACTVPCRPYSFLQPGRLLVRCYSCADI